MNFFKRYGFLRPVNTRSVNIPESSYIQNHTPDVFNQKLL